MDEQQLKAELEAVVKKHTDAITASIEEECKKLVAKLKEAEE